MLDVFLKKAIFRHLEETKLYFDKLLKVTDGSLEKMMEQNEKEPDSFLFKIPAEDTRPLGEVILHVIRSLEYYVIGIMTDQWEALPYTLTDFSTILEVVNLYTNTVELFKVHLNNMSSERLDEVVTKFSRSATRAELLMEMLEHSIHHRGQLSVYFRLLDLEPPAIPYII